MEFHKHIRQPTVRCLLLNTIFLTVYSCCHLYDGSGRALWDEQTGCNAMKIYFKKAIPGNYATCIQILRCHASKSTISLRKPRSKVSLLCSQIIISNVACFPNYFAFQAIVLTYSSFFLCNEYMYFHINDSN